MQATRKARLQSVVLEEVSRLLHREIKDPRIPTLTLTRVEITSDAESATIYFTIFAANGTGDSSPEIKECLKGLSSASGFIRRHLAKILNIRQVPTVTFKHDKGLENSLRVHELLKEIEGEK